MALRHETHAAAKAAHQHSRTAAEQAGAAADHAKTAAAVAEKAANLSKSATEAVATHRGESTRYHGETMKRFDVLADQLAENTRLHDRVHELERERADWHKERAALVAANTRLSDENVKLREFVPAAWPLLASPDGNTATSPVEASGVPEPAGSNGEGGAAGPSVIKPARTRKPAAAKGSGTAAEDGET